MRREKRKPSAGNENLAPEGEIVQKGKTNYKSRYTGMLSPESEIVQGPLKSTYRSRYK